MKGQKIAIIIVTTLLLVGIGTLIFLILNDRLIFLNVPSIPESEEAQVEILKEIYSDSIKDISNEYGIILDESATRNILTGKQLKDTSLDLLKEIERESINTQVYTISAQYDEKTGVISLGLVESYDEKMGGCSEEIKIKYILKEKNQKITFKQYGNIKNSDVMHAPTEESGENSVETTKIPRAVRIKGDVYVENGPSDIIRCGMTDGRILTTVDEGELPTKDNESNFGVGYHYIGPLDKDFVIVSIDWKDYIFVKMQ